MILLVNGEPHRSERVKNQVINFVVTGVTQHFKNKKERFFLKTLLKTNTGLVFKIILRARNIPYSVLKEANTLLFVELYHIS